MIDRLPPFGPPAVSEPAPRKPRDEAGADFLGWLSHGKGDASDSGVPDDATRIRQIQPAHSDGLQPTSLSPAVGQPIEQVPIELHFHGADGGQRAVAVQWRLAASGHLEWSSFTMRDQTTDARMPVALVAPNTAGSWFDATTSAPSSFLTTGRLAQQAMLAREFASSMRSMDGSGAADEAAAATSPAWAGMAEAWHERVLRWVQRQGFAPEAWVRDYRLDEGGANRLAQELQDRAREQGLHLDRIVVNAREVWRAPHRETTETP